LTPIVTIKKIQTDSQPEIATGFGMPRILQRQGLAANGRLRVPIWMENLDHLHASIVLDGEWASSYSREV